MKHVTIIDYGIGNLLSISRALEFLGARVALTSDPDKVKRAEFLVLPGVGAFKSGMQGLQERQLVQPIREYVKKGNPFLGICLGMQLMLDSSDEDGWHEGLGLIKGSVRTLPSHTAGGKVNKVPHVAWSRILPGHGGGSLASVLSSRPYMYFVHSYYVAPEVENQCIGRSSFNDLEFTSIVQKDHLIGTQFHPEKSGEKGLELLEAVLTNL